MRVWMLCAAVAAFSCDGGVASARQHQDTPRKAYEAPNGAASASPRAYPPGDLNSFAKDLDLPEIGHYQDEVLRVVEGGFFPVTVVELAVTWPGDPVQVMVMHAQGRGRWTVTSRKFATMSWQDFSTWRADLLQLVQDTAKRTASYERSPRRIGMLCTDDGGGTLMYGSGHVYPFTISLSGCGNAAVGRLDLRIQAAAEKLTANSPEVAR